MKRTTKQITTPVLLHGTWARGTQWTQSESNLVKTLRQEFGEPIALEWEGRNRDTDRRYAAEQLVTTIQGREGTHILIAHSHGGNIAVQAAADPRLHGKIAGIICLNTPFISLIRRDYTTRLALLMMLAVVAPILWIVGGLLNNVNSILLEGAIILGTASVIALALAGMMPVVRHLQNRGSVIWERLAPTHMQDVPVFCISAGDDEAQYGLSLLEHAANLPTVLQHPFMMAVLFFGFIGLEVAGQLPEWSLFGLSAGPVFESFVYVLAFFLALQLISLAFSLMASRIALGLGFSYWPLLYNFFVRVSITLTPLNYRVVDFIDVVIPAGDKRSWLAHSRIYQDERVIRHVVSWIRNRGSSPPVEKGDQLIEKSA